MPHKSSSNLKNLRLCSTCLTRQQFPESDKTQQPPRYPGCLFVNINVKIPLSLERFEVLMRGVCHVHRCPSRTQASFRRCALWLGSKRLCQHPRLSPERSGHVFNGCAHVGVRHVFTQIALSTCL